jgi:hypothetical protein
VRISMSVFFDRFTLFRCGRWRWRCRRRRCRLVIECMRMETWSSLLDGFELDRCLEIVWARGSHG